MATLERRKTIKDEMITDTIFDKLLYTVCNKLLDSEITQRKIINTSLELNLSNQTIARLINELIPTAKATKGSVASQLRAIKKSKSKDELLEALIMELE